MGTWIGAPEAARPAVRHPGRPGAGGANERAAPRPAAADGQQTAPATRAASEASRPGQFTSSTSPTDAMSAGSSVPSHRARVLVRNQISTGIGGIRVSIWPWVPGHQCSNLPIVAAECGGAELTTRRGPLIFRMRIDSLGCGRRQRGPSRRMRVARLARTNIRLACKKPPPLAPTSPSRDPGDRGDSRLLRGGDGGRLDDALGCRRSSRGASRRGWSPTSGP